MKKQLRFIFLFVFLSAQIIASYSQATIQIIHNSSDPAAALVDVYVNGTLSLNNFAFRTATSFITLPSGTVQNIGIAPGNSTSVTDTIVNFPVTLTIGHRYLAVANGVLNPANFAVNPDGTSTGFTLFLKDNVQNVATTSNVDFIAVHGASDAPTVDIIARNVATLVNNASYSNITGYITVPPASYTLDVTPAAGTPIVATFTADLATLGGGSAVVFASGFLEPSANQNGPAFGLFAALADGTVFAFPAASVARLQVVHNAADPAAAVVDIYVNGVLFKNNFAFRAATPYLNVPADVVLNIGIAPGNSSSAADTLKNFPVTLANGGEYLAVANGVLTPASFAPNPNATATGFTLFIQNQMREVALTTDVDFRVVHGATDAPVVDVLSGTTVLVDNASYTNITPYIAVPAASYTLKVTPGNNNSIVVASFLAPLTALAGKSAVILASGFLTPSANQNGPAFRLFAVLADGTTFLLDIATGIEEMDAASMFQMYPNPANNEVNILLSQNVENGIVTLTNSVGQVVKSQKITNKGVVTISLSSLTKGTYLVRVKSDTVNSVSKLIVE